MTFGGDGQNVGTGFIRIRPNTAGFEQEARTGLTGSVKKIALLVGGMFAGREIYKGVKDLVAAGREMRLQERLTGAVIKSTGGIARVTADHVSKYASKLAELTGIDDTNIQANERLLLTFTGVRNEVGKGNDIFDQATTAVQNMSVALGEDAKNATIQLGKALQDPIKGATALRRVGVALTKSQQDQIKSLVAHGKLLQAQKIILGELKTEFGGAAAAAADPEKKLSATLQHLREELGVRLLPVIDAVAGFLADKLPGALDAAGRGFAFVWKYASAFGRVIVAAFNGADTSGGNRIVVILGAVGHGLRTVVDFVRAYVIPAFLAIGRFILGTVVPALVQFYVWYYTTLYRGLRIVVGWITGTLIPKMQMLAGAFLAAFSGEGITSDGIVGVAERIGVALRAIVQWVQGTFLPAMQRVGVWLEVHVLPVLRAIADYLRTHWRGALEIAAIAIALLISPFAAVVTGVVYAWTHFKTFRDVVQSVIGFITGTVIPQVKLFADYWSSRWADIQAAATNVMRGVAVLLLPLIVAIRASVAVILFIWDHFGTEIVAVLRAAWTVIAAVVKAAFLVIKGIFDVFLGLFSGDWGRVWDGLKTIFSAAWGLLWTVIKTSLGTLLTLFKNLPGDALHAVGDIGHFIWNGIKAGFAWLTSNVGSVAGHIVDWFTGLPGRLLGVAGKLLNAGASLAGKLVTGIINGLKDLPGLVVKALTGVLGGVDLGKGPAQSDLQRNTAFLPPSQRKKLGVTHSAHGNVFARPSLSVVGDSGPGNPELVAPQSMIDDRLDRAFARHANRSLTIEQLVVQGVGSTPESLMHVVQHDLGWLLATTGGPR